MLLTTIFYYSDNFCKDFDKYLNKKSIPLQKKKVGRKPQLTKSEIMTIVIYFHHSRMRTFKDYYNIMVKGFMKQAFPNLVSYNRFVELMKDIFLPMYLFLKCYCAGKVTGIAFIDSMPLGVCHNLRIYSNKVFKGYAGRGKSSTGWFYGFKLHLIINQYGEIISFSITPGNVDDRNRKVMDQLTKNLFGKLFGDRGYISKSLFEELYSKGVHLFTKIKKNMKNTILELEDKLLLNKRGLIESVNERLQSACQVKHSRHRSVLNFFINILSGLVAYAFLDKKPSIVNFSNCRLDSN
jgi:hypothetical protein